MRQANLGYRIDTRGWRDVLSNSSDKWQREIEEARDSTIKFTTNDKYDISDFGPIQTPLNDDAKYTEIKEKYSEVDEVKVNGAKSDMAFLGKEELNDFFANRMDFSINRLLTESVDRIYTGNQSMQRNKTKITANISSLKSRYGDKFGDEETSEIKEIETNNDGVNPFSDVEIKERQENSFKRWQEKVLNLPWGD